MGNSKTVCITGGTGLLGKGVIEESAASDYRMISIHQRDYKVEDTIAEHMRVDVRERKEVDRLFSTCQFNTVVHAAGISSVDYVELHYDESLESNLAGTRNIALACRDAGCHLIYVSTNAVFDGANAPYREADPMRPINKYGQIKAECENLVSKTLTDFTIVRPILMYGWNHQVGRLNPATWILHKLLRGEAIKMVNDVRENPLYNRQCGEVIWKVIKSRLSGIVHVAGSETLTRYEFALKVAKVFGLDASLIEPVQSSYFESIAPRPKNTSFVTERMEYELGMRPLNVERGLRLMREHMKVRA